MYLSGKHKDTTGRWTKAILLKMSACVSSIVFLQEKKRWQRMLWPISYNGSHFPLHFPLQKQTVQSTIRNKNKWSAITAKGRGRDNPFDNGDTTRGLDTRLDAGSGGWHRFFFYRNAWLHLTQLIRPATLIQSVSSLGSSQKVLQRSPILHKD